MCREPALNLLHCKKRQRKKERRKHTETRMAKVNVLPGNKGMSWIWKEENWPNWGLFIVTNTGKGFRQENMRNVNKVSRHRERVFGNTTSDYMSHCPLAWVRSRVGVTEGRPMALVTSTAAPRPPAEADLLWKPALSTNR